MVEAGLQACSLWAKVFETSELDNDNPFVKEILRTGREIL